MNTENLNPDNDAQFEKIDINADIAKPEPDFDVNQHFIDQENADQDFLTEQFSSDLVPPAADPNVQTPPPADTAAGEEDPEGFEFTDEELEASVAQSTQKEIDDFNEKFGTSFKNKSEIANALKQEDNKEETKQIDDDRKVLSYHQSLVNGSDEDLLFADLRITAYQAGKDINDEDVIQEIRDEIQGHKDANTFKYVVGAVRRDMNDKIRERQSRLQAYDDKQNLSVTEREAAKKLAIQEALQNYSSKNDFYGVVLEKEDYINAYQDVRKGTLQELLTKDPKVAVELQLLYNQRQKLAAISSSATYNDGVADTLSRFKGQSPRTQSVVRNNRQAQSSSDTILNDWTK